MDKSGGYLDFPFVADFYDDTVPYKDRTDVQFFVEDDMCSFDLGEQFSLITMPFRPFQHITTVDEPNC